MEIQVFTTSQDSTGTEFETLWCLVKSHLKQEGQTVRLSFSYGNSGYSIRIFTDVCSLVKKKKFNIADHYRSSLKCI